MQITVGELRNILTLADQFDIIPIDTEQAQALYNVLMQENTAESLYYAQRLWKLINKEERGSESDHDGGHSNLADLVGSGSGWYCRVGTRLQRQPRGPALRLHAGSEPAGNV